MKLGLCMSLICTGPTSELSFWLLVAVTPCAFTVDEAEAKRGVCSYEGGLLVDLDLNPALSLELRTLSGFCCIHPREFIRNLNVFALKGEKPENEGQRLGCISLRGPQALMLSGVVQGTW